MRILNELRKFGYFWLPDSSHLKITGLITIQDGGSVILELIGNIMPKSFTGKIKCIIGLLEDNMTITLRDCYQTNSNFILFSDAPAKNQIKCGIALLSTQPYHGSLEFDNITFSYEHLFNWMGITGISYGIQDKSINAIEYNKPDKITIPIIDNLNLIIHFGYKVHGIGLSFKSSIEQTVCFEFSSEKEHSIQQLLKYIYILQAFIILATDAHVNINDISCNCFKENNKQEIAIFKPTRNFSLNFDNYEHDDVIFNFSHIMNDIDTYLHNWFILFEKIEPAIQLFVRTRELKTKTSAYNFLSTIQSLEVIHRTLFKNHKNIHLIKRLTELSNRFPELFSLIKYDIDDYAFKTKELRNYFTHLDNYEKIKDILHNDFFVLYSISEILIQLHLLAEIGMSQSEILNLLYNTLYFTQKIRIIRINM